MKIREHIQSTAPETYAAFTKRYDGGTLPEVVGIKIDTMTSRIFVDAFDEDDLNEFARSFVADLVVLELIPTWIDFWQVQSRRSDSTGTGPGFEGLPGESSINYDRVEGLRRLAEMVRARVAAGYQDFLEAASEFLRSSGGEGVGYGGVHVSSTEDELKSIDPQVWSGPVSRVMGEFGVIYVEKP